MRVSIAESILELEPSEWATIAAGSSPFIQFPFVAALERSGSVGEGTGWLPRYFLAWEEERLVGAVPAWLKGHSYGEYIFDWAWADGAQRAGLPYYPKAVVAVPFTPATDRRILLGPSGNEGVARALVDSLLGDARSQGLSSVHWLFTTEAEKELLEASGHIPRTTLQFHWRNRGWSSFEDYLGSMRGKRRREIRRERRKIAEGPCRVRMLEGPELEDEHWNAMDRFYRSTAARKWGHPYLSESFFECIRRDFAEAVRFAEARCGDRLVAGALFFQRGQSLYGRYWGCDEAHRHLHFETCFYSAIEYCIDQGLERYEAGAQGEHKLARGFEPQAIHSAHWIADPRLSAAVKEFCRAEATHTARIIGSLEQHSVFRDDGPEPGSP